MDSSGDAGSPDEVQRPLRVVTRHDTRAQFIAAFAGFAEGRSLFIPTNKPLPKGTVRVLDLRLKGGEPLLHGQAEVVAVHEANDGPKRLNGMRLMFLELSSDTGEMLALLEQKPETAPDLELEPAAPPLVDGAEPATMIAPGVPAVSLATTKVPHLGQPRPESRYDTVVTPIVWAPRRFRRRQLFIGAGLGCALGLVAGYIIWNDAAAPPTAKAAPAAVVSASPPAAPVVAHAPAPPLASPKLPPPPETCEARISSEPTGAEVRWAGRRLGTTPLVREVPCKRARLTLTLEHYRAITKELSPKPRHAAILKLQLQKAQTRLSLTSTPEGARFMIDGATVGSSPAAASVDDPSSVIVTATQPHYKPWTQRIYVSGETMAVHATLEPAKK